MTDTTTTTTTTERQLAEPPCEPPCVEGLAHRWSDGHTVYDEPGWIGRRVLAFYAVCRYCGTRRKETGQYERIRYEPGIPDWGAVFAAKRAATLDERLAACALVRRRWAGRADLTWAARSDELALLRLERRLGLIDAAGYAAAVEAEVDRRLLADLWDEVRCGRSEGRHVAALLLGLCRTPAQRWYWARTAVARGALGRLPSLRLAAQRVEALRRDRQLRAHVAAHDHSVVACERGIQCPRWQRGLDRLPQAQRALAEARRVLDAARLRRAIHDHTDTIRYVTEGREGAEASTEQVRPSSLGLPRAYARQGYWVTSSAHSWCVSRAILSPEVRGANAAQREYVYLAPDVRVRSGRGTALVIERLTARGAWR
jgi:hypothetical protein